MPAADRPIRNLNRHDPLLLPPLPTKKTIQARELVEASGSGPITSRNTPVGGETGRCRNNKTDTLIYDYGAESWAYNTYFSQLTADQLIWFFYDDPYTEPNISTPGVSNPTEENSLPIIIIPKYKFTDNTKHDVLGVRVPASNNKGYIDYKIKFAPKATPGTSLAPLWFYIEEFQGAGQPMRKKWGDLASALSPSQHEAIYGDPNNMEEEECPGTSFGKKRKHLKNKKVNSLNKVNSDIKYLKR